MPRKLYYVLGKPGGMTGGGKYTNLPDAARKARGIGGRLFVTETDWQEIILEDDDGKVSQG
jgi:hypothetical protein